MPKCWSCGDDGGLHHCPICDNKFCYMCFDEDYGTCGDCAVGAIEDAKKAAREARAKKRKKKKK